MNTEFRFYSQQNLVKLLGIRARNPAELLDIVRKVPLSSIYYHTHRFLQQHHYLSPEPPNDFAYWLTSVLNLRELGEQIASVDIVNYSDLEELRSGFIRILEGYISGGKHTVTCPEGYEFHFMSCVTFVFPTNYTAQNLAEFAEALKKISVNSIYFHMFEARLRIKKDENDFSAWLKTLGYEELAQKIKTIDPYTITLEGLRKKLIVMAGKYA